MPRLLILCEFPTLLGGERSMLSTLPAVAADGFDVHVAAPPDGPLAAALRERGVEQITWRTHDARGKRLPLDRIRGDLSELFRRVRPDLVHANSLSTSRISGPVPASCGLPSLGHVRDIIKLTQQAILDVNAHRRLIAVSQSTRDYHVTQGIDAAKCVVVHNGVDLQEFQPQAATGYLHQKLRLPPTARLVATIGQLGLRKGTDVALVAAQRVVTQMPDVPWLIVGERTSDKNESRVFEAHLHTFASSPPLTGRVHFLGVRSDIPKLLAECELLVHAARQEPLGRVLLEAASCGVPVVATDVGGTREIFPTDLEGGVVVPAGDSLVIADAVIRLLRDPILRQLLGRAARRRAQQAFDIRQAAARLIKQYHEVLT